jgi:thiamine pyrophosphokinase
MSPTGERPQMEFRGLRRRGEILSAILVLTGAKRTELKRASAVCGLMADRCLLVAVDGGLRTCRAARRRPDLFVGDGDSLRSKPPTDIPSIVLPEDKDFSDLAGALDAMRERRVQIVCVAGLAGGRIDHEWANLLEVAAHARSFAGILAPTDRGTVIVTSHGYRASTVRGRMFSMFTLGATATVTLSGTRWQLNRRRVRPGSHGLSNVTGTELDLIVHRGVAALVLLPPRRSRSRTGRTAAEATRAG